MGGNPTSPKMRSLSSPCHSPQSPAATVVGIVVGARIPNARSESGFRQENRSDEGGASSSGMTPPDSSGRDTLLDQNAAAADTTSVENVDYLCCDEDLEEEEVQILSDQEVEAIPGPSGVNRETSRGDDEVQILSEKISLKHQLLKLLRSEPSGGGGGGDDDDDDTLLLMKLAQFFTSEQLRKMTADKEKDDDVADEPSLQTASSEVGAPANNFYVERAISSSSPHPNTAPCPQDDSEVDDGTNANVVNGGDNAGGAEGVSPREREWGDLGRRSPYDFEEE